MSNLDNIVSLEQANRKQCCVVVRVEFTILFCFIFTDLIILLRVDSVVACLRLLAVSERNGGTEYQISASRTKYIIDLTLLRYFLSASLCWKKQNKQTQQFVLFYYVIEHECFLNHENVCHGRTKTSIGFFVFQGASLTCHRHTRIFIYLFIFVGVFTYLFFLNQSWTWLSLRAFCRWMI